MSGLSNDRYCGNCEHWKHRGEKSDPGICSLSDCVTRFNNKCGGWEAILPKKRCGNCTHFDEPRWYCNLKNVHRYSNRDVCTCWLAEMPEEFKCEISCCHNCKHWEHHDSNVGDCHVIKNTTSRWTSCDKWKPILSKKAKWCVLCKYWQMNETVPNIGTCSLDAERTSYRFGCKGWVEQHAKKICGDCTHWAEPTASKDSDGICMASRDCFTGRGCTCVEWQPKEKQRLKRNCGNCKHWNPRDCGTYFKECLLSGDVSNRSYCCSKWDTKDRPTAYQYDKWPIHRCGTCKHHNAFCSSCDIGNPHEAYSVYDTCDCWEWKGSQLDMSVACCDSCKYWASSFEGKEKPCIKLGVIKQQPVKTHPYFHCTHFEKIDQKEQQAREVTEHLKILHDYRRKLDERQQKQELKEPLMCCMNCLHWSFFSEGIHKSCNMWATGVIKTKSNDYCCNWRAYSIERQQMTKETSKCCGTCKYYAPAFCKHSNIYAQKGWGAGCKSWRLKERQQMTVTKKTCEKCCWNCGQWSGYSCEYLNDKRVNKASGIPVYTPSDYSCNQWQAKKKPKADATIGVNVELNGVPEFEDELKHIEEMIDRLTGKLSKTFQALADALSKEDYDNW